MDGVNHHAVSRLLRGGRPDPGFGSGGRVVLDPATTLTVSALTLDDHRRIVAAGLRLGSFAVARFSPRGVPDAGFGEGGFRVVPPQGGIAVSATDVALQRDGKIVVTTATFARKLGFWGLARLLP